MLYRTVTLIQQSVKIKISTRIQFKIYLAETIGLKSVITLGSTQVQLDHMKALTWVI